jgi:hypothetical protein
VKKSFLSPVTSLVVSLSLALGILVCNMCDYGFLTTAHACDGGVTVLGETMTLNNALAPNGVSFHNLLVNGQLIEAGVIAGPVQLVGGGVTNVNGVIVSNGESEPAPNGVIVSNGGPCTNGVIVSNGGETVTNGVIVSNGDGEQSAGSAVTVSGEVSFSGYIISASGTANGGTLTGDNISITEGGVITGENLLLSGTTIDGGFMNMSGDLTGVSGTPAN